VLRHRPPSAKQQQASQQNQAAKQGLAQRGGLMGMLGGLAIGGLLGALLFGGAFENLNLMDFLIFGGIAFMLYKLLSARSRATPQPAYNRAPHTRLDSSASASRDGSSGFDSRTGFAVRRRPQATRTNPPPCTPSRLQQFRKV
jgi:predicted lipid-binding transport protein (Tim44 family)